MNPYKDVEESSFTSHHVSYEDIATKLLKDNYFLTALELHTELIENGRELPQLREFFSNPGNFEQHVSRTSEFGSMHRTPSQGTLDSLDTARYSEDGGGDRGGSGGDVAVLEFELRKARETINSLRANLTQFADEDTVLDKTSKGKFNERSLKPHEKSALNFLINEYLLLQNYKLTSITFSDENPDQDFEDWDDVGLNMPRPAGLTSLFRGDTSLINTPKSDVCVQTEILESCMMESQTDVYDHNICINDQTDLHSEADWNHEILIQAEEIELLKQKVIALETEKLNYQKLYDAAIISLNSLATPTSESKGLELHLNEEKLQSTQKTDEKHNIENRPITWAATENHYGSENSTHSATPELFEMIDNEKGGSLVRKESSITSSLERAVCRESSVADSPQRRSSVTTLDETLSINDNGEWTRVQYNYNQETNCKEMWVDSPIPNSLKSAVMNWCCEVLNLNEPLPNELLTELVTSDKPVSLGRLLTLVADTLPRLIPHTLVGARCEATAALAATVLLSAPADPRRARALHTLLTLVKKPSAQDARCICEAASFIVKWGGSGEVLSSVAELMSSKTLERRILASQICLAVAPYVPIDLCTSLLLSLVVLMCESSETEIRSLGLKAASLICLVADSKYGQLENLMFSFLKDPVDSNVKDAVNIFVPVLARTALLTGKFNTDLCSRILENLSKVSNKEEWKDVVLYLEVFRSLVLAKLAFVINVQIVKDYNMNCDSEVNLQDVPLENEQTNFIDLQCYMSESKDGRTLLVALNSLIESSPDITWMELSWYLELVQQILQMSINHKFLNHASAYESVLSLFSGYAENFGSQFVVNKLKPVFMKYINDLEQKLEKLHSVNIEETIAVGIYLVTILPEIEDIAQQQEFLQKWVVYSSIRGLPQKIFSIPMKWVAQHRSHSFSVYLEHIKKFVTNSSQSPSGASIKIFVANLLTDVLNTVVVNDSCIEDIVLPTVIEMLGDDDTSVREASLTTWGDVTRVCVTRGLECEGVCWTPLEQMLDTRELGVKETARAAEALALLITPSPFDCAVVSEKAVDLLWAVCARGRLSGESAGAVTSRLQLLPPPRAPHPARLPALRKLEECVQASNLPQYKPILDSLIQSATGIQVFESSRESTSKPASNLQAAQEVGRRVSQIFQQSKTNMNIPNIFKKKT